MKSNQTLVQFSVKGVEIRGEVVRTDDARRKIVFLAGYRPETAGSWRGTLPENGQMWIVDVVHDTKPSESFRGALMVRLGRQVRWALMPVGEAVNGQREMRPVCLDDEGISPVYCQSFTRQEIEAANAPWRDAQTRLRKEKETAESIEATWKHGQAEGFFKTFGRPDAVTPRDDGTIVLSYARGEKVVPSWGILGWLNEISQPEATSWAWDEASQSAKVTFTFVEFGVATTLDVCRLENLVEGVLPPQWEHVNPEMKAEIISFIWENDLLSPTTWAQFRWADLWESRSKRLDKAVEEPLLALAHPGESRLFHSSYNVQEEVTTSYGDSSWGTGTYMSRSYSQPYLMCGVNTASLSSWRKTVGAYSIACCYGNTVEAARQEILEGAMKKFAESLLTDWWVVPPREFFLDEQAHATWRDSYRQAYVAARRETLTNWWGELGQKMAADRLAWEMIEELKVKAAAAFIEAREPLAKGENIEAIREEIARISLLAELSREVNIFRDRFQAIHSSREWYGLDSELCGLLQERFASWANIPSTVEEMVTWRAETEALFSKLDANRVELQRQCEEAAQARAEAAIRETQAFIPHQAGVEESTEINPRIVAFAEAVREIVGVRLGIEILRGELSAPYGRARRQDGIRAGVPGIDQTRVGSTFLGFSRATDVDTWLFEAISSLEKSTTVSSKASQATTQSTNVDKPVEVGKLDLSGLFGGGARVKK